MTTNRIRTILALLVGALAFAGSAAAQGHAYADATADAGGASGDAMAYADETTAHGDAALGSEDAAAGAETGLYDEGNYGDLDATAAAENAGLALDADGSVAEAEEVAEGGFWAWLSLHVGAFLAGLSDLVGADAPSVAPDAGVDAYVGAEGVDLDAAATVPCTGVTEETLPCGEQTLDGSPAGDVDGMTWNVPARGVQVG